MKLKNIKWDTDGNQEAYDSLPQEVEVPSRFLKENYIEDGKLNEDAMWDDISDWLSDTYGFCHGGFEVEEENILC